MLAFFNHMLRLLDGCAERRGPGLHAHLCGRGWPQVAGGRQHYVRLLHMVVEHKFGSLRIIQKIQGWRWGQIPLIWVQTYTSEI